MRYCPFCSVENADEAKECESCARRMPPLALRRRRARALQSVPASPVKKKSIEDLEIPLLIREEKSEEAALPTLEVESSLEKCPDLVLSQCSIDSKVDMVASNSAPKTGPVESLSQQNVDWGQAADDLQTEERIAQEESVAPVSSRWPSARKKLPEGLIFTPPSVLPMPQVPLGGWFESIKYEVIFERAKWQRRGVIKKLRQDMRIQTGLLDTVLGALGQEARVLEIESPAFFEENRAIDEAHKRKANAEVDCSAMSNRQADENRKYSGGEANRRNKIKEAETALHTTESKLREFETKKRGLQEERKSLEARQRGYLKAADNRESESLKEENHALGLAMKTGAETLRQDAAALDREKVGIDQELEDIEAPMGQIESRIGALRSDMEAAKHALSDFRELHHQHLSEIEAEQGQKTRELAQAESEILRREVTLGTLINLERVDCPELLLFYQKIDEFRGGIAIRSNTIDKLSAEREVYNKGARLRGVLGLVGIFVLFLFLIVLLKLVF